MSDFDTLVNKVLRREGGYANNPADRGGETNKGISKRAHPTVDIRNLTDEGARDIYRTHYWDAIQADKLPESIRDLAFDTAVQHGAGTARKWITRAKSDPQALLTIRTAALEKQAANDPSQQQFLQGWRNRMAEFTNPVSEPTKTPVAKAVRSYTADEFLSGVRNLDVALQQGAQDEALKVEVQPTAWEQFGAAVAGNTDQRLARAVMRRWTDEFPPTPGFVVPEADLLNIDSVRAADRMKARSQAELDNIKGYERQEDDRLKALMSDGVGTGLAMSFGAELLAVTNWVAPFAASRSLGMSAYRAAAAGRTGAAVSRSIAESAVAGTAIEAGIQAAEGRYDPANLFLAAGADIVIGGAIGLQTARMGLLQKATTDAIEREMSLAMRAQQNVGEGATPDQINTEYLRLRAEEIKQPLTAAASPIPEQRKLMERPDELGEEPSVAVAKEEPYVPPEPIKGWEQVHNGVTYKLSGVQGDEVITAYKDGQEVGSLYFSTGIDYRGGLVNPDVYVEEAFRRQGIATQMYRLAEEAGGKIPSASQAGVRTEAGEAMRQALAQRGIGVGPVSSSDAEVAGVAGIKVNLSQSLADVEAKYGADVATRYESNQLQQNRIMRANDPNSALSKSVNTITGGEFKSYQELLDLPTGVHFTKAMQANAGMTPAKNILAALAKEYLPNSRVIFSDKVIGSEKGVITSIGNTHVIGVVHTPSPLGVAHTTMHELGHAIFHEKIKAAPANMLERIEAEYLAFVRSAELGDPSAVAKRFAATSDRRHEKQLKLGEYNLSRNEWVAENFVKHVQKRLTEGDNRNLPKGVVNTILDGIKSVIEFFFKGKKEGLIDPAESLDDFFKAVLDNSLNNRNAIVGDLNAGPATAADEAAKAAGGVENFLKDPVAIAKGLATLPVGTAAERADAKAILNLHKKADAWAAKNPRDDAWMARANQLIDNSVLPAASTGLQLLKSPNNVARMIASELLEDASGVGTKRQSTAAISKYLHQRQFMGNAINDVQNAYELWRNAAGGSIKEDYLGGAYRQRFDRAVAEEIENRRVQGTEVSADPNVKLAADSLEGAYDRIRVGQQKNQTLGHQALGETSKGYMPHKVSPGKWMAASNAQRRVMHDALVDQFVSIEGWDISFSDALASRYLDRVQQRATGGHDSPIGGASSGSAEIIEDALLSMGMTVEEVRKHMQRFNRGAANWTKGRLDLDLNKPYQVEGAEFKLMDIFEIDQISLLRSQAGRASGEVALARHGVYGRPGLTLIRKAMTYGEDTARTSMRELEAYDQIAAEFMDAPFGSAEPKWMENARVLNSVVRLGGIVFNQFAEFINAVTHVGLGRTFAGIASLGRMRSEIKALAKGEVVNNPLIGSIEKLGGAEFGTDAYKIVMPFDSPDHAYPTYGKDTLTVFDRLLRGASHAQAKLSGWRTIHSVQQRAMAEQIVAKIGRYSRDGQEDVALRQFGISPEMQAAIKADGVARWEGDSLVEFDVTKLRDPVMQEELIQAVHRGVSQIIQGTFIGETGKWAHEGYLKMLTQFRTFSLTSMEKQWARQRNSRGNAAALGILMGSMFAAAPIYMARVYANSIGREDQEEYLEKRLAPEMVARQTLNYIAMSGVAGDFLDAAAALAPDAWGATMTGGRAGSDTEFVGNMVAPALSLVDDSWKALQNLDDPEKLARILPGSRLPYVLPAINALGD